MSDIVAQMAQCLMDVRYQSGELKGTPILCSDPDFNDLPLKPDDLLDEDDYSEEDIRALSKAALKFLFTKIDDPSLNTLTFVSDLRKAIEQ
jgi:hypothetical protein